MSAQVLTCYSVYGKGFFSLQFHNQGFERWHALTQHNYRRGTSLVLGPSLGLEFYNTLLLEFYTRT